MNNLKLLMKFLGNNDHIRNVEFVDGYEDSCTLLVELETEGLAQCELDNRMGNVFTQTVKLDYEIHLVDLAATKALITL